MSVGVMRDNVGREKSHKRVYRKRLKAMHCNLIYTFKTVGNHAVHVFFAHLMSSEDRRYPKKFANNDFKKQRLQHHEAWDELPACQRGSTHGYRHRVHCRCDGCCFAHRRLPENYVRKSFHGGDLHRRSLQEAVR